MTKGDSTALGVDLLLGNTELVGAPEALGRERLVDLVDVDVVLVDARKLKHLGDGLPGTDAHEQGLDADDGRGNELAEDGLAELLGRGALHEQDGGGTVRNLRGVSGVDGAVLGEGGADLAERLGGDAVADAVVAVDKDLLGLAGLGVLELGLERQDLLLEETLLLGLDGLLEGRGGEGVLVLAADALVLGHVLGEDTHGHLAVGGLGVALEEVRELGDCLGAVVGGHGLDTGADTDLDHAGADLVGDVDAGLETRGALAVEGVDGGGLGETGDESGGAHLGGATAGGEDGADLDVLDEGGVDLGALDEAAEGTGHQIRGLGVLKAALAALGEGGAESAGDDDLYRLQVLVAFFLFWMYISFGFRVVVVVCAYIVGVLLEDLVTATAGDTSGDLVTDLRKSVESCRGGRCMLAIMSVQKAGASAVSV